MVDLWKPDDCKGQEKFAIIPTLLIVILLLHISFYF